MAPPETTARSAPAAALSLNPLFVRCDGGPQVGAGHLMRCLAIAQEWQHQGGEAVFVVPATAASLTDRLVAEGMCVVFAQESQDADADHVRGLAKEAHAAGLIVDGYQFDRAFFERVRPTLPLLAMDDNGVHAAAPVDFLINPNPHANAEMYADARADTLLLGSRYTPLRREFRFARPAVRSEGDRRRLLVTMGGSDPDNTTASVLTALELAVQDRLLDPAQLEVTVVLGPAFHARKMVEAMASQLSYRVTFASNVHDMLPFYQGADASISGAGSTTWELDHLAIPQLAICLAENQRPIVQWLAAQGRAETADARDVRRAPQTLVKAIATLLGGRDSGRASERIIDGNGPGRIAMALGRPFYLRRAEERDRHFVFDLANDKVARATSFTGREIPWEDHLRWYAARLIDRQTDLLIAEGNDDNALGFVRFQRDRDDAPFEISVAVHAGMRGKGLARLLIASGCTTLFKLRGQPVVVDAFIRPENSVSKRAFARAGFTHRHDATRGGVAAEVWRREMPAEPIGELGGS